MQLEHTLTVFDIPCLLPRGVVFSYYLLSWNISPRHSPESPGTPYTSCANFQLMVYKLRRTLLEYLSTVFTNLQMSGDSQKASRRLSWWLSPRITPRGLLPSWNLEICENGREILQKCPWNFIDPQLKVGMVRRAPGDSGEFLGEEIFQERRFS